MPRRSKNPPRYVPTLTEVVSEELVPAAVVLGSAHRDKAGAEPEAVPAPAVPANTALPDPSATVNVPLAHPQLANEQETNKAPRASAKMLLGTQAVNLAHVAQAAAVSVQPTGADGKWLPDVLEEALVHRVMQRVDIELDQRLRDALAAVVQEQTRSLVSRLREEIESVVRQVVSEAVADEAAVIDAVRR